MPAQTKKRRHAALHFQVSDPFAAVATSCLQALQPLKCGDTRGDAGCVDDKAGLLVSELLQQLLGGTK